MRGFVWACVVAVVFGTGAAVAATASGTVAIVLAALGGAATLWLLQAALLRLGGPAGSGYSCAAALADAQEAVAAAPERSR